MNRLEIAILKTLLYADVFEFPLTLPEIHRYLISDESASITDIEKTLKQSPQLSQLVCQQGAFFYLLGREATIDRRQHRALIAEQLWLRANRYGKWLAWIPFVRMVTVTGALSAHNPAHPADDIDYMIVVKQGRVWFARACAVLLVRIVRLFGTELCPNYVVSEDRLVQSRQDLFVAREIAQMHPIYGKTIYEQFFAENQWVARFVANASPHHIVIEPHTPLKPFMERLFGGRFGDAIEAWEFKRKASRFQKVIAPETSSAIIDSHHVKGHFEDHGSPILRQYYHKLTDYEMDETTQLAGD